MPTEGLKNQPYRHKTKTKKGKTKKKEKKKRFHKNTKQETT